MSYTVSADTESITLGETDTVKSVLQNIAVILRTRRGTCPLYRNFGLPMNFQDKPLTAAKPLVIAEITEAVADFEPRATVKSVTFSGEDTGSLIPIVEVEINGE